MIRRPLTLLRLAMLMPTVMFLGLHVASRDRTATVHIVVVSAWTGDKLAPPVVTLFRSQLPSQARSRNFAARFQQGVAHDIPYGVYRVRVYTTGFASREQEASVYQPDVWIVVGLRPGTEGGALLSHVFRLAGAVKNLDPRAGPTWARLVGLYSLFSADAPVDESGSFVMAGMPQGRYVLLILRAGQIIAARPVDIPRAGPMLIDLKGRAEENP